MTARAPSAGMLTVAAKVPRVCIIRAFTTAWTRPCDLIREILPYVGSMNPEIEWTCYRYEGRPYYWHDVTGVSPYGGGVYRWDYSGNFKFNDGYSDVYRNFVGLLHRPRGWAEIPETERNHHV